METVELTTRSGRRMVSLRASVYQSIFDFIASTLTEHGEIDFHKLLDLAMQCKTLKFEGDKYWCLLQVKQDMEARGIISVKLGIGSRRVQKIKLLKKKMYRI